MLTKLTQRRMDAHLARRAGDRGPVLRHGCTQLLALVEQAAALTQEFNFDVRELEIGDNQAPERSPTPRQIARSWRISRLRGSSHE